jgi:hypothetical protein
LERQLAKKPPILALRAVQGPAPSVVKRLILAHTHNLLHITFQEQNSPHPIFVNWRDFNSNTATVIIAILLLNGLFLNAE